MSEHFSSEGIVVSYFNINLMLHVHDFNIHELESPVRPFAALETNGRSPLFSVHFDDHEGTHFFEDLVSMIYVCFDQVQFQIAN